MTLRPGLRGRVALGGAALGLVLAAALPPSPAQAVQNVLGGSWWRSQPDGAPLPPPPQVPDGGLWVAADPSGPSAVSAARVELGSGESAPVLHLRVHSNQSSSPPSVVACPATGPWQPATAGAWSSRPPSDCARGKATGALSADGATMTFDLTALVTDGQADVVLQPAADDTSGAPPSSPVPGAPAPPGSGAPGPVPGYDLTFERPAAGDVAVTAAPQASPDESFAPTPLESSPALAAPVTQPSFSPAGAFTPAVAALGPTAAQPVISEPAPAAAAAAPSATPTFGLRRASAHSGRTDRVLAGVAFVALALWAWRVMSTDGEGGVEGAAGAAGKPARPRLTLYDAPELASGPGRRRYGSGPRLGLPPALR